MRLFNLETFWKQHLGHMGEQTARLLKIRDASHLPVPEMRSSDAWNLEG